VAIRPRSLIGCTWVPRSMTPWGQGLGTNGGQASTYFCKMRIPRRIVTIVADARNGVGADNGRVQGAALVASA
jgi:hypothetical protein